MSLGFQIRVGKQKCCGHNLPSWLDYLNFQIPGGLNSKVVQLSEIHTFFVKNLNNQVQTLYILRIFFENYFCKYIRPSKTLFFNAEKPEPENLENFIA